MVPDTDPLPSLPDSRTAEQLRRAQRLEGLGALAGRAAHDFNNVLGVVLGYVELAKMGLGEEHPKVRRHLDLALSTVDRVRELADSLLDVAHREARTPDVAEPEAAVRSACALLARTLDPRITLVVETDPAAPCTPLDLPTLRQVVMNLCLNAADAMPEGGRLEVQTERVVLADSPALPAGCYSVLRVRDSGPGVSEVARARLFEPWFSTRPEDRSGLGLWVARTGVERVGGRIEVGGDGQGAEFAVWLPHALAVRPPPAATEPPGGPVLLVDADAAARAVLRLQLEKDGHEVLEAASAAEADAILRAGAVAVLLVDGALPDVPGADLVWQAAALPHAPRILWLGPAQAVGALPAGTGMLPKPFLHADLTRALHEVVGNAAG